MNQICDKRKIIQVALVANEVAYWYLHAYPNGSVDLSGEEQVWTPFKVNIMDVNKNPNHK